MPVKKRRCVSCGKEKPLTPKHFQRHGSYFNKKCKPCEKLKWNSTPTDIMSRMLAHYRFRARREDVRFDVTAEYLDCLFDAQKKQCFYTETPLKMEITNAHDVNGISLDRIIPSEGYVKGNVVFCTRLANSMKNDLSLEDLEEYYPEWFNKLEKLDDTISVCEEEKETCCDDNDITEAKDSPCQMKGDLYGAKAKCKGKSDFSVRVYPEPRYDPSDSDEIEVCSNCYRSLKKAERKGKIGKVSLG